MFLTIAKGPQIAPNAALKCALSWVALPNGGTTHPAGQVYIGKVADADLVFGLSKTALHGADVIATHPVLLPAGPALLRIDEVCFPVGAIAHRHTHTGAGFRVLTRGALQIEAGSDARRIAQGDHWFEPADTPVRAVALQSTGVTSFVRCMVVPPQYEGKSTFTLVDLADAELPRLQMTHRHIDHPVYVDAG